MDNAQYPVHFGQLINHFYKRKTVANANLLFISNHSDFFRSLGLMVLNNFSDYKVNGLNCLTAAYFIYNHLGK